MKELLKATAFVLTILLIIGGVASVAYNAAEYFGTRRCASLAEDIGYPAIYMNSQCWIEVCPDVRLPQYNIVYHIDLIQSCAQEQAQ